MTTLSPAFGEAYATALEGYLARSSEHALHLAYGLGRQALHEGLGILDVTLFHHGALARYRRTHSPGFQDNWLDLAADFLAECLSPFEMTLLGYKEANNRLLQAHAQLEAEMEERRKIEEALLHAKKLQAVGLLAGGVAHHFNNLLTVVLGNVDMVLRRMDDEQMRAKLQAARTGAEYGAEITRHLLSFSRQQMLQAQTIEMTGWLAEINGLLTSSLRADIRVETAFDGEVTHVVVDRSQLDLAILNLAMNARDAMPNGGVLRIAVRSERVADRLGLDGDFVIVDISDTGVGIDPALQSQVFEPFFTTKGIGSGTGLGLSHVHGFAHQSGGGVALVSEPGRGTTVSLYLPTANHASALAEGADAPLPAEAGAGHVLVVEDDRAVANVASQLLESFGYSVQHAYQAHAALDLLRKGEPVDLVFSDIVMPGDMDGVALAEEIHRSFPRIPVLLTSGYNEALEKIDAGEVAFIVKPYRSDDLRKKVGELLETAS